MSWLQLGIITLMLILIVLFLLSKTQNSMFLSSLCQQKSSKNYQNCLVQDLKDYFIRIFIKQKVRIKGQKINADIFSNQTLWMLTDCFFWLTQIKI